jgi:hypothetical protein
MSVLRRFITLILVALVAGGCSKYVEIPRDQLDTVPDREDGYRVNLTDGTYYTALKFTTNEEVLAITKLSPHDPHYRRVPLPMVILWNDVESVSEYQKREGWAAAIAAATFVVIFFVASMVNGS